MSGEASVRRGPGHLFHAQLAIAVLLLLVAVSHPGIDGFLQLLGVLWLLGLGAFWAISGVRHVVRAQSGDPASGRRFVAAPLVLLVLFAVVKADLPLRARWALSKPGFEAAVEDPPTIEAGERIGLYTIAHVSQHADALLFYDEAGRPYGFAGFAYLPTGPSEELESLNEATWFREFDGEWYVFFASP